MIKVTTLLSQAILSKMSKDWGKKHDSVKSTYILDGFIRFMFKGFQNNSLGMHKWE